MDWPRFLSTHGIPFVERGPSTSRGNIYIQCVWCGNADQGHHLGISLNGRGFGCWKDERHRGKNPAKLIQALLGCSWAEASRMAGTPVSAAPDGSLLDAVLRATGGQTTQPALPPLSLPKDAHSLVKTGEGRLFWRYLLDRGFPDDRISELATHFGLHYAMRGEWAYRLILPVHDADGALMTWTGRSIADDAKVRYKTLTVHPEPGEVCALAPIPDLLLDLPNLQKGGAFLVICEGPFDAMKLWLYADRYNARVTCLFGKTVSDAQINMLAGLRARYDAVFLLLDPDASMDGLRLSAKLSALRVTTLTFDCDEDPGEMSEVQIGGVFERCEFLVDLNGKPENNYREGLANM